MRRGLVQKALPASKEPHRLRRPLPEFGAAPERLEPRTAFAERTTFRLGLNLFRPGDDNPDHRSEDCRS
jgi:hypothetical protein